jgi:hypothetical protein
MPQRPVQPTNAILVSGNPIYEEYEVETAANMYPGHLVIKGTAAEQVVVATDNSVAVVGVLDVMPDKNLAEMYSDETTYSVGDQVRVIRGDCVVKLRKASGATITVGLKVQCAGDGKIDQYATANADVGIAEEAKSGNDDEWIIVKLTNV